jgi:RecB family exonuclease
MRKTYEELNSIKDKYGVDTLWSWSRYHKYKTSQYEYFLSYVANPKVKPDRDDSIYGASGGFAHDILEKFYKEEITYDELDTEFDNATITLEVADLKFDRSNEEKNDQIKEKYMANLKHFFKNHNPITVKVDLERFITIKVGKYLFQGYIDITKKDLDGNFIIQDWKTSSIYKGEKAIGEAGQLILYAEGLRQLGIPLEKIKICWNFLKYVNVTTELKNGKNNIRQIERCKIGESLKANAKTWIKYFGYSDEEIDDYIELLITTNDIKCLPKEVQEKYTIDDCYVFVDLTQDMIDGLKEDIIKTLDEICDNEEQYKTTKDESLFYDSDESVEKQSYYFANLCGYSANLHKPYKKYLEKLDAKKNGADMFGGVGSDLNGNEVDDLDWLNSL